ncbi:MAG: hypothetical protein HKN13_10510 [Rhodothermales bacterium]|nr:hypothetical protein [Rhodothermales bacterium]
MHCTQKKPYIKPDFVEYGRIEDITSTKTWHSSNDWLGNVINHFLPGDHGSIIGDTRDSFS